eukprot:TRINITY_DN77102_c0_g1_i1.p1 TRINITY_DN77102_c0_g1~~TRINITY_DN77102_c0_g1_i1.p1  ORF type:complete len:170 (+),score=7.62 TRINITY_DN77102_c0_g1_i1:30-539(+)
MGSGASARPKTQPGTESDGLAPPIAGHSQTGRHVEENFHSVVSSMSKSTIGRLFQHEADSNRASGACTARGMGAPPKGSTIHRWLEQRDRQTIEDHLAQVRSSHINKHGGRPLHERPSVRGRQIFPGPKLAVKKGGGIRKLFEALDRQIIEDGLKELESRKQKRSVQRH